MRKPCPKNPDADNYVSWDKPTLISDAADVAKTFFRQLNGGETVKDAIKGITGTFVSPIDHRTDYGVSHLTALKTDDQIIIDQTPWPRSIEICPV